MRIVMMGTGLFAEPTFEALLASSHHVVGLVTQPDRVAGQERGSTRQTGRGMKTIALERNVPVLQPESINTPDGIASLKAMNPELLVVAAYGQILSKDVLAVPPLGGINVHASLLPKYRGAAPIAWAIYHGETRTGVTIIRMTTGLDAGAVLAQEAVDIGDQETAGDVEARLAALGARLALEVISCMEKGPVSGTKQDPNLVTKAPKLKKEDGLVDWSRSARQVCNQIRAMQPWPTAYTFFHHTGQPPLRLLITKAVADDSTTAAARPGHAESEGTQALFVATAEGRVKVVEVQPAGKRRMTAEEFLRGRRPGPDDFFGPETP
jgi:methionyl-tRNA formyltransferase